MKKIIIVNNNMEIGGIQKSLLNLLWALKGQYDITLCLFSPHGEYMQQIPPDVKVMHCNSLFRYLGIGQSAWTGTDKWKRGVLAAVSKLFGRPAAMHGLLASQKMLPGIYDCAIAYLQNGSIRNFYGGVQEFVLRRITAKKKVAFLHCDYGSCGSNHPHNNRLLAEFDVIAACSDGCRQSFVQVQPDLGKKCVTVRNCHCFDQIQSLAAENTVKYDPDYLHIIMVSRLAHEKGIERAIEGVVHAKRMGKPVQLHILGDGPMRGMLQDKIRQLQAAEYIHLAGAQSNPYRYMKNADLFLMTSFHEAAPMVIEEARCLGVPVLTTETTSSIEMVLECGSGWVCGNNQADINKVLLEVVSNPEALTARKGSMCSRQLDNRTALKQFCTVIGE